MQKRFVGLHSHQVDRWEFFGTHEKVAPTPPPLDLAWATRELNPALCNVT